MAELVASSVETLKEARQGVRLYSLLFTHGWVALQDDNEAADKFKACLTNLAAPIQYSSSNDSNHDAIQSTENAPFAFALTQNLIAARSRLINPSLKNTVQDKSSDGEWLMALLALNQDWRTPWLNLMAARCCEAGLMSDASVLVKLITILGEAAQWVLPQLQKANSPKIAPSPLAELERELIGHSLDENAAIPSLVRILREAFLLTQIQTQNAGSVSAFGDNWCAGRLLALPFQTLGNSSTNSPQVILRTLAADAQTKAESTQSQEEAIDYLNRHPWAMLLSLLAFTQDAWAAEQRGGLLLECPQGQNAYAPNHIQVLVQGSEGDEIAIGSLADVLLALLNELEIGIYPHIPNAQELSHQLSPLIGELLNRKLWQYRDGSSGRLGYYHIHPVFSDACYSLPLSPVFGRKSKALQQSIKACALHLREAKLLMAAASGSLDTPINIIKSTGVAHGF
jgi:hypothetical protein